MNMNFEFANEICGNFQLEQVNFIDTLVEKFTKESIALEESFAEISKFSPDTIEIMDILECKVKNFKIENAIRLLKIKFWNTVYLRSNIAELLDSKTKSEWREKLCFTNSNKNDLPDFTVENIQGTLESWYLDRDKLFADRVDAVFQSLSKTHVTNQPEGFSKKLIFSNALCSYSTELNLDYKTRDILFDFACCIATLLKHPLPKHLESFGTNYLETGVKYSFFGDYFQAQVFKSRTMHVWVHPSIALELNIWLAKKYPNAIPSSFKTKTAQIKEFVYNYEMLNSDEISFVRSVYEGRAFSSNTQVKERFAKFVGMTTDQVNELCSNRNSPFREVCKGLIRNGYPNIKDHQYYPTPEPIVEAVESYLGELVNNEDMSVLEPSAGSGRLARIFNAKSVDCVEVSPHFNEVLKSHGLANINQMDFLKFKTDKRYDLIVMNPPYANKRLELHLKHALTLMATDGELILIAPTGKLSAIEEIAQGKAINIVQSFDNVFDDTNIKTSIFSIT